MRQHAALFALTVTLLATDAAAQRQLFPGAQESMEPTAIEHEPGLPAWRLPPADVAALLDRGHEIELPLSPAREVRVTRTASRVLRPGRRVWTGHVTGAPLSSVTLIVTDGRVTGGIWHEGRRWELLPEASGASLLVEIENQEGQGGCGLADENLAADEAEFPGPGASRSGEEPVPDGDDGSIIDVLVVFTPAALDRYPEIDDRIQLAMEETNLAYANSGITQRVRLVGTRLVDYDVAEDGLQVALNRLTDVDDGVMDDVHAWRDACAADLVSLWVGYRPSYWCGYGWLLRNLSGSSARIGFSAQYASCGSSTFAHELGHNMGAHHDWEQTDAAGAFSYSKGFTQDPCGERTVMSYPGSLYCARGWYFSNPDVRADGRPMGVAIGEPGEADNRATLNATAPVVATFRESDSGCCQPDGFEAEDRCGRGAAFLGDGQIQQRGFCEDRTDWAQFSAVPGASYQIGTLDVADAVDAELSLLAADCETVLETAAPGVDGTAALQWFADRSGPVFVRIRQLAASSGPNHQYSLTALGATAPREPSAAGSQVPFVVRSGFDGLHATAEQVAEADCYAWYEGDLLEPSEPPSRRLVSAAALAEGSVRLDQAPAAGSRWVVLAAANAAGESESGANALGEARRERSGWPASGACP